MTVDPKDRTDQMKQSTSSGSKMINLSMPGKSLKARLECLIKMKYVHRGIVPLFRPDQGRAVLRYTKVGKRSPYN